MNGAPSSSSSSSPDLLEGLNGKELGVEFLFTFLFVVAVVGTNGHPIVAGVALALAIFVGGHFGSRSNHFNPAITLGLMIRRKIDQVRGTALLSVQVAAGAFGVIAAYLVRKALSLP